MAGMTTHPTVEWVARQLTEACGWSEPLRYIILADVGKATSSSSIDARRPGHIEGRGRDV
jgi:hypothetical protein